MHESATDGIVRRSLVIEGRRVSYLTVGGAPSSETLLLIHGAGVSARTWVNQLRSLSDVVRPLAIDLPGRCESDPVPHPTLVGFADTARQVLERLATGPAFVAGHSLGGAVAQVLAARHPALVKGLVLVSTCAKVPAAGGAEALLGLVPPPFRRAVFLWAARRTLLAPSASWKAIDATLDEIQGCRPATMQTDIAIGRAMDVASAARELRVPTLVLCGGRDRLIAPQLSRQLSLMIAGSRLHIVPFAGHMLPLEAPTILDQAIREFVAVVTRETRQADVRTTLLRGFIDRIGHWLRCGVRWRPAALGGRSAV